MTPAWLLSAFTAQCDIFARTEDGFDEYGNPTYTTTLTAQSPCRLEALAGADIQFGRATVANYVLYLPAEMAGQVAASSLIRIDGADYEVDGPPTAYTELFTPLGHHVEVNLIRSSA